MKQSRFWGGILDFLLPRTCFGCSQLLWQQKHFCTACVSQIDVLKLVGVRCPQCSRPALQSGSVCPSCLHLQDSYAFEQHYSLYSYSGLVKSLIIGHKFYNKNDVAIFWADSIHIALHHLDPSRDRSLVACPSTHHQAMLQQIAHQLHERYKVKTHFILQKKTGVEQKNLCLKDRLIALKGNISVTKTPPEQVILIDDIFTTGSTMGFSAQALKQAGSKSVLALTLAMVILKPKQKTKF